MNIFSWSNLAVVIMGMLLGLFAAIGIIQLNVVNSRVVAAIHVVSFSFLGLAAAFIFVLKKKHGRCGYEIEILQSANKAKNAFISMLLHFIRTPLSGIRWSLKEMIKETQEEKKKEELTKLYQENLEALNAVEHLLDVSRATIGKLSYNFEILSMKDFLQFIESALTGQKIQAKKKNISVNIQSSSPSQNSIRVDKPKISVIIQTLFDNAISYTPEGGSIKITAEEKQSAFFFSISDTGMGIPDKDQSNIFLQFFRSENARRKVPGGFGVGLYMAKTFIEKHRGKIWFISKEGSGADFIFRLPVIVSPIEKFIEKI